MIARDIIYSAFDELGVYGPGEIPEAADMALALRRLNAMLDSWTIQTPAVLVPTMVPMLLTPGIATYVVAPRPAYIVPGTFVRISPGTDLLLTALDQTDYNALPLKTAPGIPRYFYYRQTIPDGEITLFPVPSQPMELFIATNEPLTKFVDVNADVPMAPGYDEAIYLNLAVRLAPAFRRPLNPSTAARARGLRYSLFARNSQIPSSYVDSALPVGTRWNSILWG